MNTPRNRRQDEHDLAEIDAYIIKAGRRMSDIMYAGTKAQWKASKEYKELDELQTELCFERSDMERKVGFWMGEVEERRKQEALKLKE